MSPSGDGIAAFVQLLGRTSVAFKSVSHSTLSSEDIQPDNLHLRAADTLIPKKNETLDLLAKASKQPFHTHQQLLKSIKLFSHIILGYGDTLTVTSYTKT